MTNDTYPPSNGFDPHESSNTYSSQPNQDPWAASGNREPAPWTPPTQGPQPSPWNTPAPHGWNTDPTNQYPPEAQKSKVAAGILGIFLGGIGVHNFYIGRTGRGVAQLLITLLSLGFLSPISAVWGLIEGILILASNPNSEWGRDGRGIPLRD